MTPFKEKLNKELGESSLFTKELKATILHKTQQPPKEKRHWQYPVVLASMSVIILFFIIVGPWNPINSSKQATLIEIAQKEAVKEFSTNWNWDDDSFKAGRIGWIFDQEEFKQGLETELLDQVLRHAKLSEEDEHYSPFRDVWLQFEGGEIAKLKILSSDEQLAFIDMNTELFYKVDDKVAHEFTAMFNSFGQDDLQSSWIYLSFPIFLLFGWLIEKVVRKIFHIKKEPKYLSRRHMRVTIIFNVANTMTLMLIIWKDWIIYYGVIIVTIVISFISNVAIEFYFGRDEKRHYIAIANGIVLITLFILFLLYIL